jgi:diguanylate cyclase (GGDEF)-like protein
MGSVAMGTGIWSMHFVGMLALSLPMAIGFAPATTALSWAAAVGASAVALRVAGHGRLGLTRLATGALSMGAGICAMHYIGMAALQVQPPIDWNLPIVAASAGIAVAASAAALVVFFWLRQVHARRGLRYQLLASLIMGAAISGMHYTGMAAARFADGSICLSSGELAGNSLGAALTLSSVGMLALVLFTSTLDARLQSRTARLAGSLEAANAQLQSANEALKQQAFVDPLTGLANRTQFEARLAQAVQRCQSQDASTRDGGRLAVLFVDLDGFKSVNDSLGHGAGDQVLRQAAARLLQAARKSDTVARIGGDEFVFLMERLGDVHDGVGVASRLVEALAVPFEVASRQVEISCSVGVAIYPDHGGLDNLVAHADAAMYAAKRAGGNTCATYAPHMDAGAADQLGLQNDLRHAIRLGQLQLHYQPKVDGVHGQIRGVEALLRWTHPERGAVGPAVFVPLAERFGMICALGDWVIDEACRQMSVWAERGIRMRVAINVSVHQLREEHVVQQVERALARHGLDPSQLLCEITESAAMEDLRATQRALEGLARIGVFLSIDDFGTGYSSLSYLRQLPARQLKIDRSFVRDIETSEDARAIVNGVINLAHALGLAVVAEGVETAAQRAILERLKCDELQGYYFARPMSAQSLMQWLLGNKPHGAPDFSPSVLHAFDPEAHAPAAVAQRLRGSRPQGADLATVAWTRPEPAV